MEFEIISNLAYREGQMPKEATILELLIYYMLKDLYNKHYQGKLDTEQGKKEKNKIEAYYNEQLKYEKFYKELMNTLANNTKMAEDDLCRITKMLNAKEKPEEILKVALNCIANLVNDSTLKNIM